MVSDEIGVSGRVQVDRICSGVPMTRFRLGGLTSVTDSTIWLVFPSVCIQAFRKSILCQFICLVSERFIGIYYELSSSSL